MKMKKVISSLLVLAMGVSLMAGCGSGNSEEGDDGKIQIKVQYISGRMNMDFVKVWMM